MSENVGGIEYDVGFDLSKLLAGERQINSTINNVTNNFSKIESAVKPLAGLISAAFATAALTAFIKEVATVQRQFDIINAGLVTATGSTLEAAKAFKVLHNISLLRRSDRHHHFTPITTSFLRSSDGGYFAILIIHSSFGD